MNRVLKWTGIGLGGIVGVAVVAAALLYFMGASRLSRRYDIQVAAVAVPTDAAAIARGRHLAEAVTLCHACHGDGLGGDVLIDEPLIATVYASNLTAGRGGVGATYGDADYVRAIRHGVDRAGRGLMIMHSDAYHNLGQADLGAIIGYIKSMSPVDHEVPRTRGGPLGKILVALGLFDTGAMPLIPAEVIDHRAPFADVPPQGATSAFGRYLVSIALCGMCHGPDLRGGPPVEEGSPPGPTLAVYGAPDGWSEEQFVSTIRTGIAPHGKALEPKAMPWQVYAKMTDEELGAIWRYLASLNSAAR
jgi:mono/diheme cytochrome c family protein